MLEVHQLSHHCRSQQDSAHTRFCPLTPQSSLQRVMKQDFQPDLSSRFPSRSLRLPFSVFDKFESALTTCDNFRDMFNFLAPHQRRRFFVNSFCPKSFDCPTRSLLRAFCSSPWGRELQNTLLEQTSIEGTTGSHKAQCGFLFRSRRGFCVG